MVVYIAFFFNPRAKFCMFTKVCVVFSFILFVLWELESLISYQQYEKLFDRWAFVASIFTTVVLSYQSIAKYYRNKLLKSKIKL
jgi:hypothetical protein